MPDANGDRTAQRLDDLGQMDKLLLRAQVLQQRALEILEQTVSRHEEAIAKHDQWIDEYRRETAQRERGIDERIAKLVSAIGELVRRDQGRPPANA